MQIGFFTSCFHNLALEDIIPWAGANGFTALEIETKGHGASPPSLDAMTFDSRRADALLALARNSGISLSCISYNENFLDHDSARREWHIKYLGRVMDAAVLLGISVVNIFIGRDPTKTQSQNFDEMERVFTPLLDSAQQSGLRLGVENCPMVGWQFEGLPGNIAYSPENWEEMFRRLPHPNLGLVLDPSHLAWLGVDWNAAARDFAPRIFFTHAKDTEIFPARRDHNSILDVSFPTWWRYRVPGLGVIDWREWVRALCAAGYNGALSIEHEDPEYEGTEAKVKEGLLLGKKNLELSL